MKIADHHEQERKVREAMKKHGHDHEVTYHHGLVEHNPNVLDAIEELEDK